MMYNWSIVEEEIKKDPEKYNTWRLEQLINFGLGGEKINKDQLRKYFSRLQIDPARRRFLQILLDERSNS